MKVKVSGPMSLRKFYALTDEDHIVCLGDHEDFSDADSVSPPNTVWIFDATTMRQWFTEIKQQTPEELI
jgi:hypothetical protein